MKLFFTKMHGCGNDYIYFDAFTQHIPDPEAPVSYTHLRITASLKTWLPKTSMVFFMAFSPKVLFTPARARLSQINKKEAP